MRDVKLQVIDQSTVEIIMIFKGVTFEVSKERIKNLEKSLEVSWVKVRGLYLKKNQIYITLNSSIDLAPTYELIDEISSNIEKLFEIKFI